MTLPNKSLLQTAAALEVSAMEKAVTDRQRRAVGWPRLLGAILLAAGLQSGLGAWAVGTGEVAAYLLGCAITTSVIGVLLLAVPLGPGTAPDHSRK